MVLLEAAWLKVDELQGSTSINSPSTITPKTLKYFLLGDGNVSLVLGDSQSLFCFSWDQSKCGKVTACNAPENEQIHPWN